MRDGQFFVAWSAGPAGGETPKAGWGPHPDRLTGQSYNHSSERARAYPTALVAMVDLQAMAVCPASLARGDALPGTGFLGAGRVWRLRRREGRATRPGLLLTGELLVALSGVYRLVDELAQVVVPFLRRHVGG